MPYIKNNIDISEMYDQFLLSVVQSIPICPFPTFSAKTKANETYFQWLKTSPAPQAKMHFYLFLKLILSFDYYT